MHRDWKRGFDLGLGSIILLCAVPLALITVLAIKLDSPGPAVYHQLRIGKNGTFFRCYKFRTMFSNNDQILQQYLRENPEAREQWERYAKLKNKDPRVTKIGSILRKSSMDELPQILNVLKGEMSLVGPRPYLPCERNKMGEYHEEITKIRPGITGLWQVQGRNEIDFLGRLRIDSWYTNNYTLKLDFIILLRTVLVVIQGRGAY